MMRIVYSLSSLFLYSLFVAPGDAQSVVYTPTSLTFPGTGTSEQIVKITNPGTAAAVFSDYIVPTPDFSIDYMPPTSVVPACNSSTDAAPNLTAGASCAIGIIYTPTTQKVNAPFGNNLSIDLCPPCLGNFYNLPLTVGGSGPALTFAPKLLSFPATPAGTVSAPIQVTVTNTGDSAFQFSVPPGSSVFKVPSISCGQTISAHSSCILTFTFNPPATTAPGTILSADSFNSPSNPINMVGTTATFPYNAVGAVTAPPPAITLSPSTITLTAVAGGSDTLTPLTVTVTNASNVPVTNLNITVSDPLHIIIDKAGNCQSLTSLTPAATCTFDVYFRPPATPQTVPGTITVSYTGNAITGQATAVFTGIAATAAPKMPAVSFDESNLGMYGPPGTVTRPATVTITNSGNADLVFPAAAVTFDASKGFSKTNDTCSGKTVTAGNVCVLSFTYSDLAPGSKTTVTLTDNATPPTQTINLVGAPLLTVSDDKVILASPTTTPINFDAIVNKQVANATITLTNTGNASLTIQGVRLQNSGNGFALGSVTPCLTTLQPGANGGPGDACFFPVTFTPTGSDGVFPNQLIVSTAQMPDVEISLVGNAPAAPPNTVQFQTATVGDNSKTLTEEPVDGATGQYYEDEVDFDLGGPLRFQFGRYYGSSLSVGGYKSEMGTNWMNNFDASVAINGSSAQVMMFRGKIFNFTQSAGVWTVTAPAGVVYQFAATPTGFQFMSPVSNSIYTFNKSGLLVGIADRRGNALTIVQGPNGPASISDGLGRTLTLTYANGLLSSVADQSGRTVQYTYANGLLASATDANKATTQYKYTTVGSFTGLMTQKVLPAGNVPDTQTYDITGKVVTQAEPDGSTRTFAYDGKGGASISSPTGNVSQQSNNPLGEIGKMTDPAGNSSTLTYDNLGRRTSFSDRNGGIVKFSYHDPTGNLASRTTPLGQTTTYSYTPQTQSGFTFYNNTGVTYPDGTQTSMAYDSNGNVISRTTADGAVQSRTYDAKNRLASSTDASQQVTKFSYGNDGSMTSKTDPLGNIWTYSSNAAGLFAKINDPNGGTTSLTYDADNRPLTLTNPTGATVAYQYDANGQVIATTNPYGGVAQRAYTAAGRRASATDPLGNQTTYAYAPDGRLRSITNAAGEMVSRTYDAVGHTTQISGNEGPRMNYAWDAEDHVISQTGPTGLTTSFAYDAEGKLVGSTKPDGSQYTFGYDTRGRLLSMTNPLGETQAMTRDVMGRVTQVSLPGGLSSSIQFDARGAATAITGPNGNTWSFARDPLGRIASITDPIGNASVRTYTGAWLTGINTSLGSETIAHDAAGRVTQRQYSDGVTYNTAWDPMGLLISADGVSIQRDAMGHPVIVNGMAMTYTPAGRLAGITYAPNQTISYSYDTSGRLSTVADWLGGQTSFTYDAASRITGVTYPNGVTTSYTFDANGRLAGIATGSVASISLTRDADGKITSANRNLPAAPALQTQSQQYGYNGGSQLTSENYDAMGRALTQNGRTYSWNLASQLTGFQDSMNAGTLTYDGIGEPASSNVTGTTQNFVFNPAAPLPALSIVRTGGADLRYYVYTPGGEPLYSIEAADNSRKFYHFDEMGNTTFLTGDDGSVTDTYAITPYGEIADHAGTAENPFTWQGQYGVMQEAPGLYFIRARHYDASAGRFLSPDPLIAPDPRSAEPYVYARSNPMSYADPSGAFAINLAQIASFEAQLGESDDQVPTPDDCNKIFQLDPSDTSGLTTDMWFALTNSVASGYTWWQIKDYYADDSSLQSQPVPPSNENGLAHCLGILNGCLEGLGALTSAFATGAGGAPEISVATIVAGGGGNIVAGGGGNIVAGGGGNIVAGGGGNVVNTNGSNIVAAGGGNVVNTNGSNIVAAGGGNVVNTNGSNIVAGGGGNIVAGGGGNAVGQSGSGLISQDGSGLISQDGSGLISQDGSGLISQDGSGLISQDGSGLINGAGSK